MNKTRSVMDLQGLLKRDGAEPVPVEAMRIGRDPEPLDLVLLDPATLAEALHEARRNASRCYARDAWAVYMRDPGALTDAAMLIEHQAGELARLQRELAGLRRAQALGVAATPELIGVALDELATPADDVGELP